MLHEQAKKMQNSKLAPFNRLPARPEYIVKVMEALGDEENDISRPIEIQRKTGLTRTQVMCTLEHLLAEKKITAKGSPRKFSLLQNSDK